MKIESAKHSKWMETHRWETCELGMEPLGAFLCDYIVSERDGFVLSLNSAWGSGKTELLKRIYVELLSRNHPVIYIDAWESDFTKEPLRVIASELIGQIKLLTDSNEPNENLTRIKKLIGECLKGTAISLSQYLSKQILQDGDYLKNIVEKFVNAESVELFETISKEYEEQVASIAGIRESLSKYALDISDVSLPVVVLVDELDRCRPNYSIEMLESIKHFFCTKNFAFIVANDTKQLASSIKVLYGNNFDSHQYLKRFFNRSITLPKPDLTSYVNINYPKLHITPNFAIEDKFGLTMDQCSPLAAIFEAFNYELRDVDQLLAKYKSCILQIEGMGRRNSKKYMYNKFLLLVGLCMYEKCPEEFRQQSDSAPFLVENKAKPTFWDGTTFSELIKIFSDFYFVKNSSLGSDKRPCLTTGKIFNTWETGLLGSGRIQLRNSLSAYHTILANSFGGFFVEKHMDRYRKTIGSDCAVFLWSDYRRVIEFSGMLD